ncbi:MAG: biopolymer transporter ExbD [Candidatus Marinimicrobia bacterium]|nr:biopolymer transporter ExbD [Candidatus Neomarinimicrobiota bacterium]
MAKRGRSSEPDPGINMTPMIDVVFQMIIFFVCTSDMDRKAFDERIRLAMAPHGKPVEQQDPRTVQIEVTREGQIKLAHMLMSPAVLQSMLRTTVARSGQTTPVVIRADGRSLHEEVKKVMDAVSGAGLWKIKFAATREAAARPAE